MRHQENSIQFCEFHQDWLQVYADRDPFFPVNLDPIELETRLDKMKSAIDVVINAIQKSTFFNNWINLYNQNDRNRRAVSNILSSEYHAGYYGLIGLRVIENSLMNWYGGNNQKLLKIINPMKSHEMTAHVLMPEVVCRLIQEDVRKHHPNIQLSLENAYLIMKESNIYGQIMFGDN
jgi:hypothetical protein